MSRFFRPLLFLILLSLFNLFPAQAPSTACPRNLKTKFSLPKPIEHFPSTLPGINLKTETLIGHFGFVFEERSHDYRNFIVLEKHQFQNVFGPF